MKSLNNKELESINGGTLAYDIGWAIFWGVSYAGSGGATYISELAGLTYDAHYNN